MPREAAAESLDRGVRSALRSAGFAVGGAVKWVGEQTSAISARLRGQASGELAPSRSGEMACHEAAGNLPDLTAGQPFPGAEFFALVNLLDAGDVHYYGIDMGTSAFTVRCGPNGSTSFGHWNSMESALKRLDQFEGPDTHLALMVYDSVPVMALSALGVHTLQALDTSEVLAIEGTS
jgi:hypothetical protein